MKNLISKSLLLIATGLVVLSVATPANAEPKVMRFSIPFSFLAGDQTYAAGDYWLWLDKDFRLVDLRSAQASVVSRVFTPNRISGNGAPVTNGYLQFKRYGDSHVLAAVWPYGATEGFGLQRSKAEAELAKTHGSGGATEATVQMVR